MQVNRPDSGIETDTVVMSYYPVGGNDGNTRPRYQVEADITGFDIVGIPRVGSNTLSIDSNLRKQLSPELFDEALADDAVQFDNLTMNYDRIIWRGQSTGTFPTLNVVKNGLVKATHLLVEDGINLRVGVDGFSIPLWKAQLEWLKYDRNEAKNMSKNLDPDWVKPEGIPQNRFSITTKHFVEQYHWSPLWRSSYSRDAILEIAQNLTKLPIFIKFLGHSATATDSELMQTISELVEIKQNRQAITTSEADIKINYDVSAWHGYLLYPQFGSKNLIATANMKSLVT